MSKLVPISLLLIFSILFDFSLGVEIGTQYVYRYSGRAATGIPELKDQYGAADLLFRVVVQAADPQTILVQLKDGQIKRSGNFVGNPSNKAAVAEDIETPVPDQEHLEAPFKVSHNKGSFVSAEFNSAEPQWVVNFKKGIVSQILIDLTGVRASGAVPDLQTLTEGRSVSFQTFEDSVTGDCSTNIRVNRLSDAQVYQSDAFKLPSFDEICKGKAVYEIVKSKDYNGCKSYHVNFAADPAPFACRTDRGNCGDVIKRLFTTQYIACGDSPTALTFVLAGSYGNHHISPYNIKTENLAIITISKWTLERKEPVTASLIVSSTPRLYDSLGYSFDDTKQAGKPSLTEAHTKSTVQTSTITKLIPDGLRSVAKDLTEQPVSNRDNLQRLTNLQRALQVLSLVELRSLWEQLKGESNVLTDLFVDSLVASGSNPAIMLVKELIENKQIDEVTSSFALSAIGFFAKNPTSCLLRELLGFAQKDAIQSSKALRQTTYVAIADLVGSNCVAKGGFKRYSDLIIEDFCGAKDEVLKVLLPMLAKELEESKTGADRIIALAALGSLGTEDVIPMLQPYINGKEESPAERVRALISLVRVADIAPQKVQEIAAALVADVNERPEVRMIATSLLFFSGAPLAQWQRVATGTWFETSEQVLAYTSSLIKTLAALPPTTPASADLSQKARQVLPVVKPAPWGFAYSFSDIQASYLHDKETGVNMLTDHLSVADELLPVYFANKYVYQFGPSVVDPLTITMYNYNMGDIFSGIMEKIYGKSASPLSSKARENTERLRSIWDSLNVAARPADKRAGLLHVNLMGAIDRFLDLENIDETLLSFVAKSTDKPIPISITKFRVLSEYVVRLPNELGLPTVYSFAVPIVYSIQGTVKVEGNGLKSDLAIEYATQTTADVRVELPGAGYYVAAGADNNAIVRLPRDLKFSWTPGHFEITSTPEKQAIELMRLHTKPYTISRDISKIYLPAVEDEDVHLVKKVDEPKLRSWQLGSLVGANIKFVGHVGDEFAEMRQFFAWLTEPDINFVSNLGFNPVTLRHREYTVKYDPVGTEAKAIHYSFKRQHVTKASSNTLFYESGSGKQMKVGRPEFASSGPIFPELKQLLEHVFKNVESGKGWILSNSIASERLDGKTHHLVNKIGVAQDAFYTKDYLDWKIEQYVSDGTGNKEVTWAFCVDSVRKWNKPAAQGFTEKDLSLIEDDDIAFGENCDEYKMKFVAVVSRDEEAARLARESPAGRECQATGSVPACTEARKLDQIYNVYDLSLETEKGLHPSIAPFMEWAMKNFNMLVYPFMVKHTVYDREEPFQATWITRRNHHTGASNITLVRPFETIIAENIRINPEWKPFSPVTWRFASLYESLAADSHFLREAAALTTGGVTEAQCHVNPDSVYTYDGVSYDYSLNGCQHVLMTDCSKKSEVAVLSRKSEEGHQVVTVLLGKDSIELNPTGTVLVNGDAVDVKSLNDETRIEVRSPNKKSALAVVYPKSPEGILTVEVLDLGLVVKVHGNRAVLSAPYALRGRLCGLCGDYNQEKTGEFKTAGRSILSSGALMAESYKLNSGQGCPTL